MHNFEILNDVGKHRAAKKLEIHKNHQLKHSLDTEYGKCHFIS